MIEVNIGLRGAYSIQPRMCALGWRLQCRNSVVKSIGDSWGGPSMSISGGPKVIETGRRRGSLRCAASPRRRLPQTPERQPRAPASAAARFRAGNVAAVRRANATTPGTRPSTRRVAALPRRWRVSRSDAARRRKHVECTHEGMKPAPPNKRAASPPNEVRWSSALRTSIGSRSLS